MAHVAVHRKPRFSRRPTRRERRREETRDRIYRAALRLFAQRGFLQTTVEDITDAADVGKGTFFNYFPTKEHVLASFGDERLAMIERAAERSKHEPVLDAIHQLQVESAHKSGESSALLRAIFAAHASSEPVRAKLQDGLSTARQMFTQMFALGQKRGEIRLDIPAEKLGRLTHLLFLGVSLGWAMNPSFALETTVEDTWELLLPGLKGTKSRRRGTRVRNSDRRDGKLTRST